MPAALSVRIPREVVGSGTLPELSRRSPVFRLRTEASLDRLSTRSGNESKGRQEKTLASG